MAGGFYGKSKKALKLIFMALSFMTATSPGTWHCTSDNVIDKLTYAQSRL